MDDFDDDVEEEFGKEVVRDAGKKALEMLEMLGELRNLATDFRFLFEGIWD